MRIVFIAHRFPHPPVDGARVRAYRMLRHLAERHEVALVAPVRTPIEAAGVEALRDVCVSVDAVPLREPRQRWRMMRRAVLGGSLTEGYFESPELEQVARQRAVSLRAEVAVATCSSMAAPLAAIDGVPRLLDFVDLDSAKWEDYRHRHPLPLAWLYGLEAERVRRLERRCARLFDRLTLTTPAEVEAWQRWHGLTPEGSTVPVDWFPNGVDTRYFAPSDDTDPDLLCFLGRMDYWPNVRCAQRLARCILPRIRALRPSARLAIVGADPVPAVRRLGALPGVEVTGRVPDVRPWLSRAAAMLAPLDVARGVQNKVLEAMACGTPVVASAAAATGIDARPGEHLLLADDDDAVAGAALSLLSDPALRRTIGTAARVRAVNLYDWGAAMTRFEGFLLATIQEGVHA